VIRVCVAALLLVGAASQGHAQDVEEYLALAREYAAGPGDDSAKRLSSWSLANVQALAVKASLTGSLHDLMAAAMLQTDLANTIIDAQPDAADRHIAIARGLIDMIMARMTEHERVRAFSLRWMQLVVSIYTSCELLERAAEYVQHGLAMFPESPQLYVARGIIVEVGVRKKLIPDWRRGTVFSSENRPAVEEALRSAVNQYVRALTFDRHNAEAHLHLGWLRLFLSDNRAREDLAAAVADAHDDRVRYLAHLFLGGVAEHEQRLTDALQEYELSKSAGPDFQTPYAAMSRIEQALGHADRARELALAGLTLDKHNDDDPWWDHRIGFDRESLHWLRDEVRRQP
jgi:tetratricopeptide (TPR) repeat protein